MTTACACIARIRTFFAVPWRRLRDARDGGASPRAFAIAGALLAALHGPWAAAGDNEWTAIGPEGAQILTLAFSPVDAATAYAGTYGAGVLKSSDGGATWTSAGTGIPNVAIRSLVLDPVARSTVYAGTTGAGAFKSLDGGEHWTAINNGFSDAALDSINAIAIDPATPSTVYAGTSAGLFRSDDAGATWTSVVTALPTRFVSVVAIDPTTSSTVYAGMDPRERNRNAGLFKSTDAGRTWTLIHVAPYDAIDDSFIPATTLLIDPRSPSRLYLEYGSDGLFKSIDGGETWSPVPFPNPSRSSLAVAHGTFDTLYAGTYFGGLFRSTDAGDHWAPVTTRPTTRSITAVAVIGSPGTLHVATNTGILRSADDGQTWTRAGIGIRALPAQAVHVDPIDSSTIYAIVNGILMKTTDAGAHWTEVLLTTPYGAPIILFAIDPTTPSIVYAADNAGHVYKSTNAGAEWANLVDTSTYVSAIAITPSQPSTLYLASDKGVRRSDDGGASWSSAGSGLPPRQGVWTLAVDPASVDTVYAGTNDSKSQLYKSTDRGNSWQPLSVALQDGVTVKDLALDPTVRSTIYAAYGTTWDPIPSGVLKSIDGGETWVPAGQMPVSWNFSLAIDPVDPARLYAATEGGVFRSTDAAASWETLNAGLPTLVVSDVAIDRSGTLLRAATAAGLFEYRVTQSPGSGTVAVIEYYHAGLDHYFITSLPEEVAALDQNAFPGWKRTGLAFNAYATPTTGAQPVCRFFSTAFGSRSSHFYSPFADECTSAQADAHWTLESSAVFYIATPLANGTCATGLAPVYRLYNGGRGGAPNHRYTADAAVRAQMIAQGWRPEGLGPDAVQMCAPM